MISGKILHTFEIIQILMLIFHDNNIEMFLLVSISVAQVIENSDLTMSTCLFCMYFSKLCIDMKS